MFLFQALHAAQYHEVNDALMAGKVVIADRWRYSFFAHHLQQSTFGEDTKLMSQLDLLAHRTLEPNIYFLLEAPPSVAYERYLKREHSINDDGLGLMGSEYFQSVSNYYKQLAHSNDWCVIDGTQDAQVVFHEIRNIVDQKL